MDTRLWVRALTMLVSVVVFVVILSLNDKVPYKDLDAQERNRTELKASIESLRKGWAKDAFEQFDIYACEHMFYPFLFMATTGNSLLSILSAYF